MFDAKILADSYYAGSRLTTMELTYPRCIHSEFMTHRSHSRNAASSRAIPYKKMRKQIMENPFIPIEWGKNQKGMQASDEQLDSVDMTKKWLLGRDEAVKTADSLEESGLHKQLVNRVTEPWMWITVITTAVDEGWENFFHLRCDKMAEPHIQKIAYMARDHYDASEPVNLDLGEYHLPLVGFDGDDNLTLTDLIKVSVGRCARVSYLTHDGVRDVIADIKLHDFLSTNGHWSPFEHVATPTVNPGMGGNFGPKWIQYRKIFSDEMVKVRSCG